MLVRAPEGAFSLKFTKQQSDLLSFEDMVLPDRDSIVRFGSLSWLLSLSMTPLRVVVICAMFRVNSSGAGGVHVMSSCRASSSVMRALDLSFDVITGDL